MKNKSTVNLEISLVEIILSILIFAAAGVIMLNCFAIAKFTQQKSNDKTNASLIVQSSFEYMKSANSSEEMHDILQNNFLFEEIDAETNNYKYTIYYDSNFKESKKENYDFKMTINTENSNRISGQLTDIKINVERKNKYPFIKNDDGCIYSISSKKFFPMHAGGVQ